jgi:hypothetical protein
MDDMNPAMRDLFMSGEDEEAQDLDAPTDQPTADTPPVDLHHPGADHAYLNVDIRSNPDGSATCWHFTNDRRGDGRPDRHGSGWNELLVTWDEHHPSLDAAIAAVGRSRTEPSGRVVTVFHDGVRQD